MHFQGLQGHYQGCLSFTGLQGIPQGSSSRVLGSTSKLLSQCSCRRRNGTNITSINGCLADPNVVSASGLGMFCIFWAVQGSAAFWFVFGLGPTRRPLASNTYLDPKSM